ncbi:uncharacterized protein TrAtP1_004960 [Trichoderma atroviride]|uniref:uncharacterized protein n=1 Tax=Hypocrea atroviridis TaxID=63577 RepID=UPI00331AD40F|nr:hypothetical protein TrAtP1_004960 [Trichoderma atroviride]
MSQTASKVETEPDPIQISGNARPLSIAQLNIEAASGGYLTRNSSILSESDTMCPHDWYLYQGWIPTEDESLQFGNSYNFSPWIPSISQEASETQEKLSWTDPGFASDMLDSSLWLTASLLEDTTDNQLKPLYECNEESSTVSDEKETHDAAMEDGDSTRREGSISDDQQATDGEEQRRLRRIIRNLEQFESEQKRYGKQQLRAIKDGRA